MSSSFHILQKPRMGDPCNRCGDCCRRTPCAMASNFLGAPERKTCPALVESDEGSSCGIWLDPDKWLGEAEQMILGLLVAIKTGRSLEGRELVAEALGNGNGCDSADRRGIDSDLALATNLPEIFEQRVKARLQA